MKRTLDINIAGQLFRIDEDAWEVLKHYLDHVHARFKSEQGGEETLQDIEARIAEIFGGGNEPPTLVSKEMVHDMINIMGAPEDYYDNATQADKQFISTRKSMYDPNSLSARSAEDSPHFQGFRETHVSNTEGACGCNGVLLYNHWLPPLLFICHHTVFQQFPVPDTYIGTGDDKCSHTAEDCFKQ